MWSKDALGKLNEYYPFCGPCLFCGGRDKRHRLWDVWLGWHERGVSVEEIHRSFPKWPIQHIRDVIRIRPFRKGGIL